MWRGYVYQCESVDSKQFLPNRFEYYRNPKLDWQAKAIMSRYLNDVNRAKPGIANHFLTYPRDNENSKSKQELQDSIDNYRHFEIKNHSVKVEILRDLVYAHYAFRSKAQLMLKAIPGWIRTLKEADRECVNGGAKVIYDVIKNAGEVTEEMVRKQSLEYIVQPFGNAEKTINELDGNPLVYGPLPTVFCRNDLSLKYTSFSSIENAWLKEALTQFENALTTMPEREAEAVHLMRETRKHNNELRQLLDAKDVRISQLEKVVESKDEVIMQFRKQT